MEHFIELKLMGTSWRLADTSYLVRTLSRWQLTSTNYKVPLMQFNTSDAYSSEAQNTCTLQFTLLLE